MVQVLVVVDVRWEMVNFINVFKGYILIKCKMKYLIKKFFREVVYMYLNLLENILVGQIL